MGLARLFAVSAPVDAEMSSCAVTSDRGCKLLAHVLVSTWPYQEIEAMYQLWNSFDRAFGGDGNGVRVRLSVMSR